MSLYSDAVLLVTNVAETRQHELDMAAVRARTINFHAQRAAILAFPDDFKWKPVLDLLANTFIIGKDGGYPEVSIPEDTAKVLAAAYAAGMRCHLGFTGAFRAFMRKPDENAWKEDYNAWSAARDYRNAQTVSKL